MEAANTKPAIQLQATSPAKRDFSTPTPGHLGNVAPSTPATASGTENLTSQGENDDHSCDHEVNTAVVDPKVKIDDFAWDDLEQRYHDMVRERGKVEESLLAEFESLIKVRLL
jgi:hypothetical protein